LVVGTTNGERRIRHPERGLQGRRWGGRLRAWTRAALGPCEAGRPRGPPAVAVPSERRPAGV